jgi:formylglycine-generating enzyme required for sulfatase activity
MPVAPVVCPKCRQRLSVAGLAAGQKAACPKCGSTFSVPAPLSAAGATPPPLVQTATPAETAVTPAPGAAPPPTPGPATSPQPAMIGPYEVRGKLGEGAFGVVYRAHDPVLRRDVAIKVLKAAAHASAKHQERFLREAQVVGQMHHGNIVPVYQLGQTEGAYYIVSALIPGRPLDEVIPEGGLEAARAVRVTVQLLEALAYAHQRGVLHRDVKPANALLDAEDRLYLMDFGLAGLLDQADTRMTQDGTVMGTPAYMPPEQARGAVEEVGPAADQYSAGVVLFELLTGQVPFVAPNIHAVIYNIIHTAPPRPAELRPGLDPTLGAICLRALAKSPKGRFPDCGVFAETLKGWLADRDEIAVSPEPVPPVPKKQVGARNTLRASRRGSSTTQVARSSATMTTAARPPWWVWLSATAVAVALLVTAGFLLLPGEKLSPGEAPFGAARAKELQSTWAKYLGRDVEEVLDLGGGVQMEFVLIPPGTFTMGSPEGEKQRRDDEVQHEVTITKPFYLGKYPVTQQHYQQLTNTNPSWFSAGGGGKGQVAGQDTRQFPVERVSWEDAQAFCDRMARKTGCKVQLPSEAEWEYACRAGTTTPFHFGITLNGTSANCNGNYPYGTPEEGPKLERTCQAGLYPPNAWGLYDMHGNVWQWCTDWFGPYDGLGATDPLRVDKGSEDARVLRGGSWLNDPWFCRAAYRCRNAPTFRHSFAGFRVAFRLD